jgi:hypothetical protein
MNINPNIEIEDRNGTPIPIAGDPQKSIKEIIKIIDDKEEPAVKIGLIREAIIRNAISDVSFRLKDALLTALDGVYEDEKGLTGEKKLERHLLAERIYKAYKAKEEVSLKSEEIILLKTLVGKAYSVLIVGRVYELLEPVEPKKNKK